MFEKLLRKNNKEIVLGEIVIKRNGDALQVRWQPKFEQMERGLVFSLMEVMRDTSLAYARIMNGIKKGGEVSNGTIKKDRKTKSNYFG